MTEPQWLITALVDEMPAGDQALVEQTLEELADANLFGVIDALVSRVIGPIDDGPVGDYRFQRLVDAALCLRPNVEDLLWRLIEIATRPGWTGDMRDAAARQAIGVSGF